VIDREILRKAIENGHIKWQRHALERMMERGITRDSVKQILLEGEVIEEYISDKPYPSGLFFGYIEKQPLHVVAAIDMANEWCFVITAYIPDLEHFEEDFKTRRRL
jgi:hypothetical protein